MKFRLTDQDAFDAVTFEDRYVFAHRLFASLNEGRELIPNWHLEYLCEIWRQSWAGERPVVVLSAPPRSLKSFVFSVAMAAFELGHNPEMQFLHTGHTSELTGQLSNLCRRGMSLDWYQRIFPKTRIRKNKLTEMYYETTRGGFRRAISVGTSVTGLGGDVLCADDLVTASDAHNQNIQDHRALYTTNSFLTRMNHPTKGRFFCIGQRLDVNDAMKQVADRLDVPILNLPAIAQIDQAYELGGGRTYIYRAEELLHRALLGRAELARFERALGRDFRAQFLGDPDPDGGGALDFSRFGRFEDPPSGLMRFLSIDVARTPGGGDYTVVMETGYANERYYILDIKRVQYDVTRVIDFVRSRIKSVKPKGIVIETADGSGDAVRRILQREHGISNIIPASPRQSKEERVYSVYPMIEAGDVFLPRSAEWLQAFRNEFAAFPMGQHDDQLDALSQFLRYANELVRRAGGARPTRYFCDTPTYQLVGLGGTGRLVRYS